MPWPYAEEASPWARSQRVAIVLRYLRFFVGLKRVRRLYLAAEDTVFFVLVRSALERFEGGVDRYNPTIRSGPPLNYH